jgi:aryl-alcohol dehydrogenase-like predicted oxidoreductase
MSLMSRGLLLTRRWREMTEGIGVIPWSPQARGKLSRDWDYTSIRTETDEAFGRLFAKTDEADRKVADRVAEVNDLISLSNLRRCV